MAQQDTLQMWNASNGPTLAVITTPTSLTVTHTNRKKRLQEAHDNGTLAQLVASDRKMKKDTVFYPQHVRYVPGTDNLHVTGTDQSEHKFSSQFFNEQGFNIAQLISDRMLSGKPPTQIPIADAPTLRRNWMLFPLGMAALVAFGLAAIWLLAGTYGQGERIPVIALAIGKIPLVAVVAIFVAFMAGGTIASWRRSNSDMTIYQYA